MEGPWCSGGDFNEVLYLADRNGRRSSTIRTKKFLDWVTEFALIDNPTMNIQYTWSNFRESAACSKINRIFSSSQCEDKFPESSVRRLPCPVPDHCPILFDTDRPKNGPTPFRFENM